MCFTFYRQDKVSVALNQMAISRNFLRVEDRTASAASAIRVPGSVQKVENTIETNVGKVRRIRLNTTPVLAIKPACSQSTIRVSLGGKSDPHRSSIGPA